MTRERVVAAVKSGAWDRLVASDLDVRSANTWDSNLRRDPRLLVPMDVRALVCGAGAKVTRVPTVTKPPESADRPWPLPPDPFSAPRMRARGVHVHFAMPDALTRGARQSAGADTPPAGSALGLPPLPDRFVVVRMLHGTDRVRSWVLEGDRAERVGLAQWSENRARGAVAADALIPPERLTAAAGGDIAWAATVDAVIDRFAIHDDLADVPKKTLAGAVVSYFVAGWWSRPDLDPLAGVSSVGDYAARLAELGWTAPIPTTGEVVVRVADDDARLAAGFESPRPVPGPRPGPDPVTDFAPGVGEGPGHGPGPNPGPEFVPDGRGPRLHGAYVAPRVGLEDPSTRRIHAVPSQTLLHGCVFGVRVDGKGPDCAPAAAGMEVALGSHPSAALAALLAHGSGEDRAAAERLLAAFGTNLLAAIGKPDGLADVDEERHARGFLARSGGTRPVSDRIGEGDRLAPPGRAPSKTDADPRLDARRVALEFYGRGDRRPKGSRVDDARKYDRARKARGFRDVSLPQPRFHSPADPALLLRGAARSQRHGRDGRFDEQGRLGCRLASGVVRGYSGLLDGDDLPPSLRSAGSGALPLEVDDLLREAVLLDPYRIAEMAAWSRARRGMPLANATNRLQAELALRYGDVPAEAADVLRRASLVDGEDPSPAALQLWSQPWVPLWCEWEIEARLDEAPVGWELGCVDFEPADLSEGAPETHSGRALLASSSARALAGDIRRWLDEEDERDASGAGQISEGDEALLEEAARAADDADLLAGSLEGIRDRMLGLDPLATRAVRIAGDGSATTLPPADQPPRLFAGGSARLMRLRVVDAFGRHLDVPQEVLAAARIAADRAAPAGAPEFLFPPRFQCPSRLPLRFVDAAAAPGGSAEESYVDQERPDRSRNPVAGFLLPDHVDEALEFFDAAGEPLGQLLHDAASGAVVWEGAPGTPGPLGAPPQGAQPAAAHLSSLAAGLVAADSRARARDGASGESALDALLRAIDTTLWTVDPFGSTGSGALAALVGRPIVVARATLALEMRSDVAELAFESHEDREARRAAFAEIAARAVRVRLGEVTRMDDGLLAYAVDDDYETLRTVSRDVRRSARATGRGEGHFRAFGVASRDAPAIRPIEHPYLERESSVELHPGQRMRLTLLLVPGTGVCATSGVLPRKRVALAREWFQEALDKLSPSFRAGPILFEATTDGVRMPRVAALGPSQRFTHKPDPLGWRDDAILAATQTAYLPDQPAGVREGWIRAKPVAPEEGGA